MRFGWTTLIQRIVFAFSPLVGRKNFGWSLLKPFPKYLVLARSAHELIKESLLTFLGRFENGRDM